MVDDIVMIEAFGEPIHFPRVYVTLYGGLLAIFKLIHVDLKTRIGRAHV